MTVELDFNGDIDADGTLTFTVGAGAIANYNGAPLTAQLPVSAGMESVDGVDNVSVDGSNAGRERGDTHAFGGCVREFHLRRSRWCNGIRHCGRERWARSAIDARERHEGDG